MDSDKCRMLLCALETGSLNAAAEVLDKTPSGVGRAIESLEKQTGFPLIMRTHKGVSLTKEGEAMLPIIKDFVYLDDLYAQRADELCGLQTGNVTVGTAYANFYPWLSKVISSFHDAYPNITVDIVEGTSSELAGKIDAHELDFGLIAARNGEHNWTPLVEDELVAVVAKSHPLAGSATLDPEVFRTEPFILLHPGRETDNSLFFERLGFEPHIRFSTDDSLAVFAMVGNGLGIGLVNRLLALQIPDDIVSIPLEPRMTIDVGIITPSDETISPATRRFYNFAIENIDSL